MIEMAILLSPILAYVIIANIYAHDIIYPFSQVRWQDDRFKLHAVVADDGLSLPVGVYDAGHGAPTVIVFGGNIGTRQYFCVLYEPLIEAGATVIAAPYRGAEGIGGARREILFRKDARAIHDALPELLGRAPGTVHVMGYSMGTGLALEVAATGRVGQALLVAPFARLCQVMTQQSLIPACSLPWIDHWDNLQLIYQIDAQVTILHGIEDKLIPMAQSRVLSDALRAHENLGCYTLISGVGHNDIIFEQETWDSVQIWVRQLSAAADQEPTSRLIPPPTTVPKRTVPA